MVGVGPICLRIFKFKHLVFYINVGFLCWENGVFSAIWTVLFAEQSLRLTILMNVEGKAMVGMYLDYST